MKDCWLICYTELSDNEKMYIDFITKRYAEKCNEYNNEIERLQKEIEWYQKLIDRLKGEQNDLLKLCLRK